MNSPTKTGSVALLAEIFGAWLLFGVVIDLVGSGRLSFAPWTFYVNGIILAVDAVASIASIELFRISGSSSRSFAIATSVFVIASMTVADFLLDVTLSCSFNRYGSCL